MTRIHKAEGAPLHTADTAVDANAVRESLAESDPKGIYTIHEEEGGHVVRKQN